jgi:DNA-binding transcriptional regulator YiaG
MPNIMSALKTEIVRLARKETKTATDPLRKPSIATRKAVADLKRRMADLEKAVKRLDAALAKFPQPEPEPTPVSSRNWISGKGVRTLRQKLGLTQDAFAKLVGVTSKGVAKWESKPGMLRLRAATKATVLATRTLTMRTAQQRLAEMAPVKKVRKTGKKPR